MLEILAEESRTSLSEQIWWMVVSLSRRGHLSINLELVAIQRSVHLRLQVLILVARQRQPRPGLIRLQPGTRVSAAAPGAWAYTATTATCRQS